MAERFPSMRQSALASRSFMHRATKWLAGQGIRQFLDVGSGIPTQPVALSLIGPAHFIPGEQAHDPVRVLPEPLPSGSCLALTCGTPDVDPEGIAAVAKIYREQGIPASPRTKAEFARFVEGLELVEPGIALVHRWHPSGIEPPRRWDDVVSVYGALARKP